MHQSIKLIVTAFMGLFAAIAVHAQVTTSAISGRLVDNEGPVQGAVIIAVHTPSGSQFTAVSDKNGMIASDAIIKGGNGHPRAAGTFPRVLGKYVRDEKALSMTDALKKISWLPAERLGLRSKGRIEEGCDGDITVFDPETIRDGATFTDIHIKPEGIQCVLINGKKALEGKEILNGRLGRFISSDEMGRD